MVLSYVFAPGCPLVAHYVHLVVREARPLVDEPVRGRLQPLLRNVRQHLLLSAVDVLAVLALARALSDPVDQVVVFVGHVRSCR